jgi:glycine cleavage system aminomethyltransferase T
MMGYEALREGVAWLDFSARGKIKVTGEDRARLLHAMTTNHIQQLAPGQGCYAYFLSAQGRILADVNVLCRPDHFLLDTEPETREKVYQHLDKFIIADDVTLEDLTSVTATIALEGPHARNILNAIPDSAPELRGRARLRAVRASRRDGRSDPTARIRRRLGGGSGSIQHRAPRAW